jgi:hypothetical protein
MVQAQLSCSSPLWSEGFRPIEPGLPRDGVKNDGCFVCGKFE